MINQTLANLKSAWQQLTISKSGELSLRADLENGDIEKLKQHMLECLQARGGEVSARSHAAKLGEVYLDLNDVGRLRFLQVLSKDFGVDSLEVQRLATNLVDVGQAYSTSELNDLHRQLRRALRPNSLELLTQFNSLPSGVKFLVDMRADLLRLSDRGDEYLRELNKNIKSLLRSWFDVGFLSLVRISWSTPAAVLEKLIHYEAVHAIKSWSDLKNRLQSDRRCFAFFHPQMPDEPLIFVQVALVNNLSGNIQELLDESAPLIEPNSANTAIFYSITNTQTGLAGVGFGDFLIKRVVADLRAELPSLTTFSTLSPIPGFMAWLNTLEDTELLSDKEMLVLGALDQFAGLQDMLAKPDWHHDNELVNALKEPLTRLVAHYLVSEKRGLRALDPVANFHLNNGARLERVNWLADISSKGLKESAGMMVNYLYKLDDIEVNHESYRQDGEVVRSNTVAALLRKR